MIWLAGLGWCLDITHLCFFLNQSVEAVSSICTLYELGQALANLKNKKRFEELHLGPLCKVPLIHRMFRIDANTKDDDVHQIATVDILRVSLLGTGCILDHSGINPRQRVLLLWHDSLSLIAQYGLLFALESPNVQEKKQDTQNWPCWLHEGPCRPVQLWVSVWTWHQNPESWVAHFGKILHRCLPPHLINISQNSGSWRPGQWPESAQANTKGQG